MARRRAGILILALSAASATSAAAQLRPLAVRVSGPAGLDSLARLGFEVAGARAVAGGLEALIVASPETERALAGRGFLAAPPAGFPAAGPAGDSFTVFRSFDKPVSGIRATLAAWAAADTLIHVDSIGASVEGRPILAVKIGPAADSPGRPNVLFMGTHHAREWVSTEVAMSLIRWLADSAPATIASRDIWVIPVENPDGYQYTFTTDRFWRKNRRLNSDGSYGVDLNRNYPAFWAYDDVGSSGSTGAETYRGPAPASEPETRAIMAFHAAHPPVVSVSYHTYSGLVIYPYGYLPGALAPDLPLFRALAGTDLAPAVRDSVPASFHAYYHPGPGWNLYATNGEYTDWAYRAHGTIAFTPELTSGCCTPDSGLYYGFVFPDDSSLVRRVFRDNLPFALAAIAAAGNLALAAGPTGAVMSPPRIEVIRPEARVSLPSSDPQPFALSVRDARGVIAQRSLSADSLARGTIRTVWRADVTADRASALRVDGAGQGAGMTAELLSFAGAEDGDTAWRGWSRYADAVEGSWSWSTSSGVVDTLTSPVIDLRGRSRVWLQFWTRHRGSTYTPEQHGLVQVSADSGRTWSTVADVVGDGPAWYPMRVDLPMLDGARGARVRFVPVGFTWWIDAVGFASDSTGAFLSLAPPAALAVSENPVHGNLVWISWPAGTGAPRLGIYTFAGERVISTALPAGTTEYAWDLLAGPRRIVNGAYLVVLELDGRVSRRRLFVTR
ncbi:MAG TPA: M14 family metallopeptidase [Gemmatimonadales bacterium]|nr:M14 family metallopeptidase [Gemmatimonadales bacterium]